MPFLGKQQAVGFTTTTKQDLTPDGSTVAFTLNKPAASANDIEVFVGNVRQEPTDAYTVVGTTLTMSAAPASGVNFYVLFKEANQSATVPAAGTSVPGAFNVQDNFTVGDRVTIEPAARAGVNEIKSYNNSASSYMELHFDASSFRFYDSANGTYSSSTEALRVNDLGVSFDGGSNYLDDYEEGTFTPDFIENGNSGFSITGYDYQGGSYQKIGKYVYFYIELRSQGHTGATGAELFISGLPFTPNLGSSNGHVNNRRYGDFKVIGGSGAPTGEPPYNARVSNDSTEITLFKLADTTNMDEIASATTNMLRSSADTHIFVSGSYITD